MNAARRKELTNIAIVIGSLKQRLEAAAEAEREAFDSLPDNVQQGERGQVMEEFADKLDQAAESLHEVWGEIEEIVEQ